MNGTCINEGSNTRDLPPRKNRPVRILVVDDDVLVRWSLTKSLGEAGYIVVTAGDGVEAIDKLQDGAFDLVITDMQMPRMGGCELLSHVRACYPMTPVVVLSGMFSLEAAREVVEAGAAMFLQKPMDLHAISLAVERVIRGTI
jgi:DNA-binding NtrC family response regulator